MRQSAQTLDQQQQPKRRPNHQVTIKPQSLIHKFALMTASGSASQIQSTSNFSYATSNPSNKENNVSSSAGQNHPNFFFFGKSLKQASTGQSSRPKTAALQKNIEQHVPVKKDVKKKGVEQNNSLQYSADQSVEQQSSTRVPNSTELNNNLSQNLINICIQQANAKPSKPQAAAKSNHFQTLSQSPKLLMMPSPPRASSPPLENIVGGVVKGASGTEYFNRESLPVSSASGISIQPLTKQKSAQQQTQRSNVTTQRQQQTTNGHIKSQSLYRKKIVDIIQGLQQSLGVIASKVKTSMNSSTQDQALLESAMLAQKLAQLTQNMNSTSTNKNSCRKATPSECQQETRKKRTSSKKKSQKTASGAKEEISGKHYYKTIEDREESGNSRQLHDIVGFMKEKMNAIDYKIFMEAPHNQHLISGGTSGAAVVHHQRTRSDAQNIMRKKGSLTASSMSKQLATHVTSINQNYYQSVGGVSQAPAEIQNTSKHHSSSSTRQQNKNLDDNGLKMVQKILKTKKHHRQASSSRPQSASIIGSCQKQIKTTRQNGSINKKLNQMPSAIFKPSIAQHKGDLLLKQALYSTNQSIETTLPTFKESKHPSLVLPSKRASQVYENSPNIIPQQKPISITKQQIRLVPQPSTGASILAGKLTTNPSQQKHLTIKDSIKVLNNAVRIQQQQHKRMNSEGAGSNIQIIVNSQQPLVLKQKASQSLQSRGNQSRDDSQKTTSAHVAEGTGAGPGQSLVLLNINAQRYSPKSREDSINFLLQNNAQYQQNQSDIISRQNCQETQQTARSIEQTDFKNQRSTVCDQQKNDLLLLSNETTLKKKVIYQQQQQAQMVQSRPKQFSQLTVDPPQFNHYITKNSNEEYQSYQRNSMHQRTNSSNDQKIYLTDDLLMKSGRGCSNNQGVSQSKSPILNIMPTPKAVQPLAQLGTTSFSSGQNSVEQTTCIKVQPPNKVVSTSIVIVPNSQAVMGLKGGQKDLHNHRRQQSAAFNQALIHHVHQSTTSTIQKQTSTETLFRAQSQTEQQIDMTQASHMLSPRSKEKRRIVKLIKISEGVVKTTAEFYRIGKMLGKGAFGRVNLAMHKVTEKLVAVKSMNKQFLSNEQQQKNNDQQSPNTEVSVGGEKKKLLQELLILQKVATRHNNIVRLYDSFETQRHLVFVIELCAGGDLLTYVRRRGCLKEEIAREFFRQACAAVGYCHRKNIVHRDVKLDNMLLDIGPEGTSQVTLKLCDFGVSRLLQDPQNEIMTEQCGTPAYIAPEILIGCQQPNGTGYKGFSPDIWSLGVCLYAMLFGTVPFKANNMQDLHQMIVKAKFALKKKQRKEELSRDLKSLIKGLLEPDPFKRLTMKQIVNHPWVLDVSQGQPEIFSESELQAIRKDFTYKEMVTQTRKTVQSRITDQHASRLNNQGTSECLNTLPLFTEHELDEECGGGANNDQSKLGLLEGMTNNNKPPLLRNCSSKSLVLAPFNSTWSDKRMQEEIHQRFLNGSNQLDAMILDKKVIKYANRVKDLNRQYEMNNNCDLDNGVYNKFVNQSSSEEEEEEDQQSEDGSNRHLLDFKNQGSTNQNVHMFDPAQSNDYHDEGNEMGSDEQNSLVTSMNGGNNNNFFKKLPPQAPLVSQISDNGSEDELERVIRQQQQQQPESNELQQLQSLMQRNTMFATTTYTQEDERFCIDQDVVEKIESQIGYSRSFVIQSVEQLEMNDAATCYYLLDKAKQQQTSQNNRTDYSPQMFNPVNQKQERVYDDQEHRQLLLFNRSPSQANLLNFAAEPQTVKQIKPLLFKATNKENITSLEVVPHVKQPAADAKQVQKSSHIPAGMVYKRKQIM